MATGPSGVAALETQKPSFVRSDILQADDSFDEGNRPIEDVLISGNVVTDLAVHDLYLNDNAIDTCVLISQYNATPQNVVVKGNVFAQRTATAGRNWSDLKLRGIDGENRQWRLDPGNVLMFADDVLVGEASSAPARWCASRRRTVLTAFRHRRPCACSRCGKGRRAGRWPLASTEFPVGAPARATGVDLRGYQRIRLVISVGTAGGLADTMMKLRYSLDGGSTWTATAARS